MSPHQGSDCSLLLLERLEPKDSLKLYNSFRSRIYLYTCPNEFHWLSHMKRRTYKFPSHPSVCSSMANVLCYVLNLQIRCEDSRRAMVLQLECKRRRLGQQAKPVEAVGSSCCARQSNASLPLLQMLQHLYKRAG